MKAKRQRIDKICINAWETTMCHGILTIPKTARLTDDEAGSKTKLFSLLYVGIQYTNMSRCRIIRLL